MKRYLLSSLLVLCLSPILAQEAKTENLTCLDKYKAAFEERGCDHVADGMHRKVIVSVTDEYGTSCFYGKARVEGSKVTSIFIKFQDESYELFEAQHFTTSYGATIVNGISKPWVTKEDNKTFQVVFVDNIKPKKKQYMQAPDPDFDKL